MSPCEQISRRELYEPDAHVREALASALTASGCPHRTDGSACHVLDGGGNMGFFSMYALAMGADVVYVEPQIDLVEAMHLSVALNCAAERVTVLHGALTPDLPSQLPHGARLENLSLPAFRTCQLYPPLISGTTQSGTGPSGAPYITIDALVAQQRKWDVVKLDIDSFDALIVARFVDLIRNGLAEVSSFIVEWNGGENLGGILQTLQSLGYEIYRLNCHDNRRFVNESGWDTINMFRDINLEPYFEERMQQRYMRYVLRVRHGITDPLVWGEIASWGMMPVSFPPQLFMLIL